MGALDGEVVEERHGVVHERRHGHRLVWASERPFPRKS